MSTHKNAQRYSFEVCIYEPRQGYKTVTVMRYFDEIYGAESSYYFKLPWLYIIKLVTKYAKFPARIFVL